MFKIHSGCAFVAIDMAVFAEGGFAVSNFIVRICIVPKSVPGVRPFFKVVVD